MKRLLVNVQKEFCEECSLALRRFIGKMEGVKEITTENGMIEIKFDDSLINKDRLLQITKESIKKLGYKLLD
jgi:copper chaperone CopZ